MYYPLLVSALLLTGAAVSVLSAAQVTIQTLEGTGAFNNFIQKNKFTFVIFYAPTGFPETLNWYKKAVELLDTTNTDVSFASVNIETPDNKQLRLEYHGLYSSGPNIICFKKNKEPGREETCYDDQPKLIADWMKKMMNEPPSFWESIGM